MIKTRRKILFKLIYFSLLNRRFGNRSYHFQDINMSDIKISKKNRKDKERN